MSACEFICCHCGQCIYETEFVRHGRYQYHEECWTRCRVGKGEAGMSENSVTANIEVQFTVPTVAVTDAIEKRLDALDDLHGMVGILKNQVAVLMRDRARDVTEADPDRMDKSWHEEVAEALNDLQMGCYVGRYAEDEWRVYELSSMQVVSAGEDMRWALRRANAYHSDAEAKTRRGETAITPIVDPLLGWEGEPRIIPCRCLLEVNSQVLQLLSAGDVVRILPIPRQYFNGPANPFQRGDQHEGGHSDSDNLPVFDLPRVLAFVDEAYKNDDLTERLLADAALGALVRRMPLRHSLIHADYTDIGGTTCWNVTGKRGTLKGTGDTPEEALTAVIEKALVAELWQEPATDTSSEAYRAAALKEGKG